MKALLFAAMIIVLVLLRIDAPRTIRKRLEKWASSRGLRLVDTARSGKASRPTIRCRGRYFAVITKWPRRFCAQHDSPVAVQKGDSLPRLTV
jgi:hypothetical protein